VTTKYKKSTEFEILKENINDILMIPPGKILKIREHMKQQPNGYNPDISFEEKHQNIDCNGIIRMEEMKSYTVS